ncbi:MAG: amidohydrolase family protein [Pirellulales bacterium]|nr:amidohydrolase family protein [Pirellulales bacterium]
MIIAGQLLLPSVGDTCQLLPGWLRVEKGMITQVQTGHIPPSADLGGEAYLITPGFVDAHVHLPQFPVMGHDGGTLLDWLEQSVFPEEARWRDPGYAAERSQTVLRQMLSYGTTSCCAYATVHAAGAAAALECFAAAGVRAGIGQVLMDRLAPPELLCPVDQQLAETRALCQRYPRRQLANPTVIHRVEAVVTPRFALSCTDGLLHGAGEIARQTGALAQTHLAENLAECQAVARLFPGMTYTEVYARAGLLGPRTLLAHGIHLSQTERGLLRRHGGTIVHCPTANNFLMSGIMPRDQWLAESLPLALGSDIGAGTERSLVRVARAKIETAKNHSLRGQNPGKSGEVYCSPQTTPIVQPGPAPVASEHHPTPAHAWWQITAGNAARLGWEDVGRLCAGSAGDVLVIRPDADWLSAPQPLGYALFAWDDRWLRQTVVAGRVAWSAA